MSQKNQKFSLKIGYDSGCNIKYTWLLKVEYLLNRSTDLYEISNLSSIDRYWLPNYFRKDSCKHAGTKHLNICALVYAPFARLRAEIFTKLNLVVNNYLMSLSLRFRKDPRFCWGDIQLLVTMNIWYYTLNYSQFLTNKTWSSVQTPLRSYPFSLICHPLSLIPYP